FFFFYYPPTTQLFPLSLHDALPISVLLGLGFTLTERRGWLQLVCFGSMVLGMACLYLAQVRSVLLMLAFCVFAFCGMLAWRGERSEEHTSELQSRGHLVCRLLLEKK